MQDSRYWPYWCRSPALSCARSVGLTTGAWMVPCEPLCACLMLGRSLTSAASSFGRARLVAKPLTAVREALLLLAARRKEPSGLVTDLEAMVVRNGQCVSLSPSLLLASVVKRLLLDCSSSCSGKSRALGLGGRRRACDRLPQQAFHLSQSRAGEQRPTERQSQPPPTTTTTTVT